MQPDIQSFLTQYPADVYDKVVKLRTVILNVLPGVIEQLDIPAKMIAYCYGQKYAEMICTIIPSKKGIKLGFYKGVDLPDRHHLLEGPGKLSRYVVIKSEEQITSPAIKQLLENALTAYKEWKTKKLPLSSFK